MPILFQMAFGHCGGDWLLSLFDSHKNLIVLPAYSFFRSWKLSGASENISAGEMYQLWKYYIKDHRGMQHIRRKLIYGKIEEELFFSCFKKSLFRNDKPSKIDVFWAIIESYCYSKKIDLSDKKAIIIQEHLVFQFEEVYSYFPDSKYILIIRDPRASMAGSFKWLEDRFGYLSDYYYNFITELWQHSKDMYFKYRHILNDNMLIVKNEDLHADLKLNMNLIAQWVDIEFSNSLLRSTFSGRTWVGESAWMKTDNPDGTGEYPQEYEEFYRLENVKKRWIKVLTIKDIKIIEFLTKPLMKHFGYKPLYNNIFNRIYGYFSYFLPQRGIVKYWFKVYPDIVEFNFGSKKIKKNRLNMMVLTYKASPNFIKLIILIFYTSIHRFHIYFMPSGRVNRYT